MKKRVLHSIACVIVSVALTVSCSMNAKAVELNQPVLNAADPQAIQQQELLNALLLQQQAEAIQAAQAQQQLLLDAIAAQQKQVQDALLAQQKQAQEALLAQQALMTAAQKSSLEAANAIQAASLVTPQADVVCDTNCAEQNALIYSKTIPDFVLVDISEQRVVFYRNGVRILGDSCVTGDASRGHNTSVGVHRILFMDTNRTLKGSYGTAFVRYWMRFTSGGQGLHDAGWRNNFGNAIYVSNGSHGCVNLRRQTAETIFNNAFIGLFVIVEN